MRSESKSGKKAAGVADKGFWSENYRCLAKKMGENGRMGGRENNFEMVEIKSGQEVPV